MSLSAPDDGETREAGPGAPSGGASGVAGRIRRNGATRGDLVAALVVCLVLVVPGAPLLGQAGEGEGGAARAPAAVENEDENVRRWWNGWSLPSEHHRLYLGVWSAHTFESDFPDFFSNRALGAQYRGLFGVTFVNSYGEQSLALGTERAWLRGAVGPLHAMLGFRAGLIYGYDEKLTDVAGLTPVLPLVQPMAMLRVGPFSADLGVVPRVVSVTGAFVF